MHDSINPSTLNQKMFQLYDLLGDRALAEAPTLDQIRDVLTKSFAVEPVHANAEELLGSAIAVLENEEGVEPSPFLAAARELERPRKLDVPDLLGPITLAIIVLQTRVRLRRTEKGNWLIDIDKRAASDSVLRTLVAKILGFAESEKK